MDVLWVAVAAARDEWSWIKEAGRLMKLRRLSACGVCVQEGELEGGGGGRRRGVKRRFKGG